jgi:hypothetical protein
MSDNQKNKVRIYGCGGVGLNIVSMVPSMHKSALGGFAESILSYVDTSKSNMIRKDLNPEEVYIFADMDGSGKIRRENHRAILANTKVVLQQFQPTTFNIVVHSAGGGSGGVIAPAIVSELLKADKEVIVVVVGSFNSVIEVENTIKTLQSYESISSLRGKNVNMLYLENSVTQSNELTVNAQAVHLISLLLGLFSGQHEQLDTADLKTWLNHNKFTDSEPCINNVLIGQGADLKPFYEGEHFLIRDPITVATLATREMSTRYNHVPAIKFEGYVPADWKTGDDKGFAMIKDNPIHFCVMEDKMSEIFKALSNHLKSLKGLESSRVRRPSILKDLDIKDDGMIL